MAFAIIVIALFFILLSAAIAGISAAPYVPTLQRDVQRMLVLAQVEPDEVVVDLGAGDGRFLITAVREYHARGIGYEYSILPYLVATLRVVLSGTRGRIRIIFGNLYRADLTHADVVTCFLTPRAMEKLEAKFTRELRTGSRLASFAFKLPNVTATLKDKPTPRSTPIFLYRAPLSPKGKT